MPAASEPGELPSLPRTWRPLGPLVISVAVLACIAVVSAMTWIGFDEETQAKFTTFQIGTLFFLFALLVFVFWTLSRSRVTATTDGLVVVNGWRTRRLAWAQVVAVGMPPGAPWATLDLADGTTVSALGIQGSDGARARRAVTDLRLLAAALSDRGPTPND